MHIGQFSLVICSFVLAVTSYFIWPYEPSRLVPILILAGAVPLFVFARIFKRRAGIAGFAWAQMRSHMQTRNGTAPVGELLTRAQARGALDIRVQEGNNDYVLPLYGKRCHLD